MLTNRYDVELYINGESVDLGKDFDIALNNNIYNPEDVLTKTSEYSYSFTLPATKKNCIIFNYANVLSVPHKFVKTYECELSVDGIQTFKGKLRLSEASRESFKANLVVIKLNTVESIFDDATLNMIDWEVPFEGIPTINEVNADNTSRYWFPLASYGVFIKNPLKSFETYNSYSSIYQIDYTNKFYNSTFYPSLAVAEIVRKCFEYKGYEVDGSIFDDTTFNNLYMSCHLGNEQIPAYNLGNSKMGEVKLNIKSKNYLQGIKSRDEFYIATVNGTLQELQYPYCKYGLSNDIKYNFNTVSVYNLLTVNNTSTTTSSSSSNRGNRGNRGNRTVPYTNEITSQQDTFLYNKGDSFITIPNDGLYKISLSAKINVVTASTISSLTVHNSSSMKVHQYTRINGEDNEHTITIQKPSDGWNWREWKPVEVQLVRNYDNDIELIKGRESWKHGNNTPTATNSVREFTCYPHEENVNQEYPTTVISGSYPQGENDYYYQDTPSASNIHCYDPVVNKNFICGFSTFGNTASVMKNGYSWFGGDTTHNDLRCNVNGYYVHDKTDGTEERTEYNQNTCLNATTNTLSYDASGTSLNGEVHCLVYLNKDDKLSLHAITRSYEAENINGTYTDETYPIDVECNLEIKAMSPNHSDEFFGNGLSYTSNSEFSENLKLSEFLSNETKISDFINNVIKNFNLSYQQENNKVTLDIQKQSVSDANYAINIDDRVNASTSEIGTERIEYPSSMSVKYSIDTSEAGFYESVPKDKINKQDWEDFGEYGYDKIELDNTGDENESEITLQNSYCWYLPFNIKVPEYSGESITNTAKTSIDVNIPVIAKSSDFIDRGDIESYMQKDGYSLKPRFWFRTNDKVATMHTVYKNTNLDASEVDLYIPTNIKDNVDLNFYNATNGLIKRYFNITQDLSSNYVTVDCYLTPLEYFALKNGANVILDSDTYKICEIKKYSITNKNMTELKLMKL